MARLPKGIILSKQGLGRRVRTLRQQRGISQYRLAGILGTNQSNISNIERGERSITIQQAVKLAKALGVSTDRLLLGKEMQSDNDNGYLKDRRLVQSLQKIEKLSKQDRQTLLRSIETFLKGAGVS